MKTRLVVIVTAVLTLCGVASAQIDNCCFVDRQCSSDQEWTNGYWAFQNGQCAAPAPSGQPANSSAPVDNCCGFDRQCSTDAEWLSGWHAYQNNQCAAPAQPQSAPPTQPVASTPANVDNCCFVDRQCNTDLEWMAGWHAYQNGQCAAPAQPQSAPPTQPVASTPANVDNCCFVDRQCHSDQEWTDGYLAFQNGQCAAPAQRVFSAPATGGNCCSLGWQCYDEDDRAHGYWAYQINQCAGLPQTSAVSLTGPVPRIEGSSRFVSHITATLKFMKSVAPDWYNYVITGMDSIVEVPVPGWELRAECSEPVYDPVTQITSVTCLSDECTARAYDRERKVTLESCWIDSAGDPYSDQLDTAGALGHEACHIHTHEEGKYFATHGDEEAECRKFGTGAGADLSSALVLGLDRRRFREYFVKDHVLSELRRFCSQGYRADLFCPTLQRLEDIWRNVPYSVFPPGAEW